MSSSPQLATSQRPSAELLSQKLRKSIRPTDMKRDEETFKWCNDWKAGTKRSGRVEGALKLLEISNRKFEEMIFAAEFIWARESLTFTSSSINCGDYNFSFKSVKEALQRAKPQLRAQFPRTFGMECRGSEEKKFLEETAPESIFYCVHYGKFKGRGCFRRERKRFKRRARVSQGSNGEPPISNASRDAKVMSAEKMTTQGLVDEVIEDEESGDDAATEENSEINSQLKHERREASKTTEEHDDDIDMAEQPDLDAAAGYKSESEAIGEVLLTVHQSMEEYVKDSTMPGILKPDINVGEDHNRGVVAQGEVFDEVFAQKDSMDGKGAGDESKYIEISETISESCVAEETLGKNDRIIDLTEEEDVAETVVFKKEADTSDESKPHLGMSFPPAPKATWHAAANVPDIPVLVEVHSAKDKHRILRLEIQYLVDELAPKSPPRLSLQKLEEEVRGWPWIKWPDRLMFIYVSPEDKSNTPIFSERMLHTAFDDWQRKRDCGPANSSFRLYANDNDGPPPMITEP